MCGVSGIIGFNDTQVEEGQIAEFTGYLNHRGPDAQGTWLAPDRRTGFGHARLSILDLRAEAGQPMQSAQGRYIIVFNGEIYNFLELADDLKSKGYKFTTSSDTEVLLNGWDCWGLAMFARLNGMWAFAIHDSVNKESLLCRDRFGVKPLYYHLTDARFIFASEVKAIDRFTGAILEPNPEYYDGMKRLEIGDKSYLSEVKALPPGHYVTIKSDGAFSLRQWYKLGSVDVPAEFDDQAAALRELVIDACRVRLRSDVPVATCLSGGIDSGAIVSLLHAFPSGEGRFPGFNHRSFTAAFPGSELDETAAARGLAINCQTALNLKVMDCPSPEELETALRACDGPMPTMAFFPIWKLYQFVREQGIIVTLDGMGPDEMLGGYFIGGDALRGAWQLGDFPWFYDLYRTYGALYASGPAWMKRELKQLLREKGSTAKRRVKSILGFGVAASPKKGRPEIPIWIPEDHPCRTNQFERALWHQFFEGPLPFFLNQYDRCSMANGVEARMPFMDYRVVEYVFSLPLQARVGHGYTKRVLREAVKGILPDAIRLNRRKTGFNAPFNEWLQGPLHGWAMDLASTPEFMENTCFDGREMSSLIRKSGFNGAGPMHEREIWPALHMAWWLRNRRTL